MLYNILMVIQRTITNVFHFDKPFLTASVFKTSTPSHARDTMIDDVMGLAGVSSHTRGPELTGVSVSPVAFCMMIFFSLRGCNYSRVVWNEHLP